MKIATAGSRTSKRWRTQEITWDAFLARLRTPLRTGESFAEYQRMSREEQGKKKEAAGGFVGGAMQGGRRVAGAVTERWLITLDADEARRDDWDIATMICDNFAMAAYSTHSHAPEKPRLRWVIPLRRGVGREEYQAVARAVAHQLSIIETLDTSTYQPERLMYWPTCAQDGEYLCNIQDGPFLDPDVVLRWYGPGDAWKDTTAWPIASREKEVVLREAKKQADPESKPGIVGVFCRTYDVPSAIDEFLSDVYEEAGEGRYTYTGGSTSAGAVLYENGAFLYSNHATDPAGGQLCNAFDLVRIHRFGEMDEGQENQETTRLPSYKAMCAWCETLEDVKQTRTADLARSAMEDFGDLALAGAIEEGLAADVATSAPAEEEDPTAWMRLLSIDTKTNWPEATVENAVLIIENDPRLSGIWYNEMSGRCCIRDREVPWRAAGGRALDCKNGLPWDNKDPAGLRMFFSEKWHIRSKQVVQDAWAVAQIKRAWHPVRDYLKGLTWDGTERLDTMLIRWFGAEDNAYVRAAARKWACAAVARVFRPGIQMDNMLVLVGGQGIGKSRFPKIMAKDPTWFSDSVPNMDGNKSSFEPLRGKWIIEIAELAATKRSEMDAIKNFVTKPVDSYRPAYGEVLEDFPRQCVFWGTTNDAEFLKDRTGDRRFWPVEVSGVDHGRMTGLEEEVDQLWAEAVVRWREGESLWMDTPELQVLARAAQDCHSAQDEQVGQILEFLDTPLPNNWHELDKQEKRAYIAGSSVAELGPCQRRRNDICVAELRWELFGEEQKNRGRSLELAGIMNNLPGWKKLPKSYRVPGWGPQKVYVREGCGAESYTPGGRDTSRMKDGQPCVAFLTDHEKGVLA